MKKIAGYILLSSVMLFLAASTSAQPFAGEIAAFKKQDSIAPPFQNSIVFTGSSSFRLWSTVQQDFPGHLIINRGFGGSQLTDVIYYADDIIFKYNPRQVVIYCGENDVASSDSVTGDIVFRRFEILFNIIRERLPEASIVFVSLKPSPSRWGMKDRMEDANKMIKKFLRKQKKAKYINIWDPMLNAEGTPKSELFVADMLHMNAKGYAIWQKLMEPHLLKYKM